MNTRRTNTGWSKKYTPFCNIISAPSEFTFDPILFVLDRDIFILKRFHRNWRQKINSLNMKSVLERYTFTGKKKSDPSLTVTFGLKFDLTIGVGTNILTPKIFRSRTD